MKLTCCPDKPGEIYLNDTLFASVHAGQGGLGDDWAVRMHVLACELVSRWNEAEGLAAIGAERGARRAARGQGASLADKF